MCGNNDPTIASVVIPGYQNVEEALSRKTLFSASYPTPLELEVEIARYTRRVCAAIVDEE